MSGDAPTHNEQQLLLTVWQLEEDDEGAYGVVIRDELKRRTGRKLTVGAIYTTLIRLEKKGLVESALSDPEPIRGGKAKRFFAVTPDGKKAVLEARERMESLWDGLEAARGTLES